MAGEIRTTLVGNLTGDPELRFTPSGAAVAGFTVAVNPRRYDQDSRAWVDGDPSFMRCTAWRALAENMAESLRKGDRVVVTGILGQHTWQDAQSGETRSTWQLTADAVGPDLAWATARPQRTSRREQVPPDDEWANASATRPAAEPTEPAAEPTEPAGRPGPRTRAKRAAAGSAQG